MDILEALSEAQQRQLNKNKEKLKPCSHCGGNEYVIHKTTNTNGLDCYPYYCTGCGSRSPICEKKILH